MKIKKIFLVLFSSALVSGCASIASKSNYDVAISSEPSGANFIVTNRAGENVFTGLTPATVTLKASSGYFKNQTYTIRLEKPGFQQKTYTVSSKLDGWYWGNLLIGGLIGMLAIDPATGAMYKLPENLMIGLDASNDTQAGVSLTITTIENLSEDQREHLQLLAAQ